MYFFTIDPKTNNFVELPKKELQEFKFPIPVPVEIKKPEKFLSTLSLQKSDTLAKAKPLYES